MYKPRALTVIRLKKESVYIMGFMYICVYAIRLLRVAVSLSLVTLSEPYQ